MSVELTYRTRLYGPTLTSRVGSARVDRRKQAITYDHAYRIRASTTPFQPKNFTSRGNAVIDHCRSHVIDKNFSVDLQVHIRKIAEDTLYAPVSESLISIEKIFSHFLKRRIIFGYVFRLHPIHIANCAVFSDVMFLSYPRFDRTTSSFLSHVSVYDAPSLHIQARNELKTYRSH